MNENSFLQGRTENGLAASVRHGADELQSDLRSGARDVAASVSDTVGRVRDHARHWVDEGARTARAAVGALRHEAHLVGDRTVGYVRDEPIKSIAVAALAGAALAGLLMLLRSRR